jgi:hypothetical protein
VIDARTHIRDIHGTRQADQIFLKGHPFFHAGGDAPLHFGAGIVENM